MTKPKLALITLKVTATEHKALTKAAEKYTGGNLSLWLRLSGLHFKPKIVKLAYKVK